MISGFARVLVCILVFTALNPLPALAQTKKQTATTAWEHPLIRVKSVPKATKDSGRVELSVEVTNPNNKPLAFLALGVPAKPPHLPVFSVEYRRDGKWRGYLDHDPKVQPSKGVRGGELAAGASVEGKISLPPDWERVRVGFGWRMGDVKPRDVISWSREIAREEFTGKGESSQRKSQPPELRVLSVTRHVNKDFRGTSVQIEIRNPHRAPIDYYGFMPTAFSPPPPAGTISPFGSRYELTHKGVTLVKDVMIDCPVGGARLALKPGAKAVYSVWAPVVNEWDAMRIGLRWITGEAGEGQQTAWTMPIKQSQPSGEAKSNGT